MKPGRLRRPIFNKTMMQTTPSHSLDRSWSRGWQQLGLAAPTGLQQQLLQAWSEPHRSYHTLQHLAECLAHFESLRHLAAHPGEVEIALWFHDAVYDPKGSGNELHSAQWAGRELAAVGASGPQIERLHALIMATCHLAHDRPAGYDGDMELLLDIDLSILGADATRFAEYEQQVRAEYAWVPSFIYQLKRREVLQSFAQRPRIYGTEAMHALLETRARANLAAAG